MERADLVVIGGGAAAAGAALAARAAGLRTLVVRRAPGASALGTGGWRGPLPAVIADALLAQHLVHDAVDAPLPHPGGELCTFDYAPASHAAARVESGVCVVAIEGLSAFRAAALARLWGAAADAELTSDAVKLPQTPPGGWATLALAASIAADPSPLADALHGVVARTGCARVILPAVLGPADPTHVRAALEEAAGVPVGEALAVAPSLPGWRLAGALERALLAAGVSIIDGAVVDTQRTRSRVELLDVLPRDATATVQLTADRFLLATGRYIGGGITAGPAFAETVFGAPVWVEHLGERFDEADPLALSDPVRSEPQPLLTAGVRVDAAQRLAVGRDGTTLENVWAAGAVRAALDDSLGDAAADGVRAIDQMLQQQ